MKTLKQQFQEVTEDIFRSFTKEHKEQITKMYLEKSKEWLQEHSILIAIYPKCMREIIEELEQ